MSLHKLLEIRTKRKERIFVELRIASDNIATREKILNEKEKQLADYKIQRLIEQKALFDKITSKGFTVKEHDKYIAALKKTDEQELKYVEHLKMAETLLQTAKHDYQQAKEKSLAVMRELERLTEILKGSEKSEKRAALRKEETEAEDFVCSGRF